MDAEKIAKEIVDEVDDAYGLSFGDASVARKTKLRRMIREAITTVALNARAEERERCAKHLEQHGWNDTIPKAVNMREVAFRYAAAIRALRDEGK